MYKKFTFPWCGSGWGLPFFLRVYTSVLELIGLRVDRGRIDCEFATFTSGHLIWVYVCKTEVRVMPFQPGGLRAES